MSPKYPSNSKKSFVNLVVTKKREAKTPQLGPGNGSGWIDDWMNGWIDGEYHYCQNEKSRYKLHAVSQFLSQMLQDEANYGCCHGCYVRLRTFHHFVIKS